MRLAVEQLASDSVKDVGGDVSGSALAQAWRGPGGHKERVGVQVLQLQAAVAQHLHTHRVIVTHSSSEHACMADADLRIFKLVPLTL